MDRRIALALACAALLAPWAGHAQPDLAEVPEEAARRFEHILGRWSSTWEWIGPDGEAVGTERGTETARWAVEGRLVELTTEIEGRPGPSKAWMFWSAPAGLFHLVSVGPNGDLWTLSGGLEEFVITSEPRLQPDGRTMVIRISHGEESEDRLTAVMEYRYPPAEAWSVGFRQTLVRTTR
jgi:hypothetical protein